MDISCIFQTGGVEVVGCRTLKQLAVRSRFDYKLFSNTRLVGPWKILIASSCNVVNSSKLSGCELKSCLWSYSKPKCRVCLLKTSRGVKVTCQGNDSIAYIDENEINVESDNGDNSSEETNFNPEKINGSNDEIENPSLDELKKAVQKALKELEIARLNSTMFEEKAQRISETAIALKDEASNAQNSVDLTFNCIEKIENEEIAAKEAVQRATMALSLSEATLRVAIDSLQVAKERNENEEEKIIPVAEEDDESVFAAQKDTEECRLILENCEGALVQLQNRKDDLQKEVEILKESAQKAEMNALKAEEDVSNIMLLAEEAVAFELEATKRVNDAEIALQKAEKLLSISHVDNSVSQTQNVLSPSSDDLISEDKVVIEADIINDALVDGSLVSEDVPDNSQVFDDGDQESENDAKSQTKKAETHTTPPKALLKKSSRFFSASFFSSADDDTPTSFFHWLLDSTKMQIPKLLFGSLFLGAGFAFYAKRDERIYQQPDIITTSIDEVSSNAKPLVKQIRKLPKCVKKLIEMLPHQEINEEEASLLDIVWLLLASVIFVPIFQKLPGGSPVLGYLTAGILIGPYGVSQCTCYKSNS